MFHFIGSTGRTGTNYIAGTLNQLSGVLALHEGHELTSEGPKAVLPTINLENYAAFKTPQKANDVIASKRSETILANVKQDRDCSTVIDIAYYNATMAKAILAKYSHGQMVGIIRNGYDFVRSAAFIEGEDILAVGWPDPLKKLTSREAFIGMGRIRPIKGSREYGPWSEWGTIERNIWLWLQTNMLLLEARDQYPDRVTILAFETLKDDPEAFWRTILGAFGLPTDDGTVSLLSTSQADRNKKNTGYQIGALSEWTPNQANLLKAAQRQINEKWENKHG